MDLEPQIRALALRLTLIANACSTFDVELDDPNSGAAYKAAIRARIKARLQSVDTDLQALIATFP